MARLPAKNLKVRKNLTLDPLLIRDVDRANQFNSFSELVEVLLQEYVIARGGKPYKSPERRVAEGAAIKASKE